MKKKDIIKESREYTEIINTKQNLHNKYYSIFYRKNNKKNRYGISIPKKTGIAVVRNKIKRQIKNIIDNNEISIPKFYDYVIIVKKNILDLSYQDRQSQLLKLISKLGERNEKN